MIERVQPSCHDIILYAQARIDVPVRLSNEIRFSPDTMVVGVVRRGFGAG